MTSKRLDDPDELPPDDPRPWLSALADGESQAADRACKLWRDDAQARRTWHAYHLIGDVLRSEDLAASPARDAAFLAGLRQRLAAEPVVLAPVASARRAQAWLVPAAMAGGFVAVAGFLLVAGVSLPTGQPAGTGFASSSRLVGGGVTLVSNPVRAAPPTPFTRSEGIIRDARLAEYLRAHQAARGGMAAAAPLGLVRRTDAAVPAHAER